MNDGNKMKVALYCRVASADRVSLDAQEGKLRDYAEKQGYTDVEVYADNGFSGLNLSRPAFGRLMADIRDGKVKKVISANISRVGRNIMTVHDWLNSLEKYGVEMDTPDKSHELAIRFDPATILKRGVKERER